MAGFTPLMRACSEGDITSLRQLVTKYNINEQDDKGNSGLHYAAKYGYTGVVRFLIDRGANPDLLTCEERTAVIIAAEKGHLKIVKILGKTGKSIYAKALNGYTCLHTSAWQNHPEIVHYLLKEKQFDPDVRTLEGVTSLLIAAEFGNLKVARILLSFHADLSISNLRKANPIHIAAYEGHLSILEEFSKYSKFDEMIDHGKDNGRTALHLATEKGHFEVVLHLTHKNAKINKQDHDGDTAVHLAVIFKQYEILQLLLQLQPDVVNIMNREGKTALDLAKENNLKQFVHLLTSVQSTNSTADSDLGHPCTGHTRQQCMEGIIESVDVSKTMLEKLLNIMSDQSRSGGACNDTDPDRTEELDMGRCVWRGLHYIVPGDVDVDWTRGEEAGLSMQTEDSVLSLSGIDCRTMLDQWHDEMEDTLKLLGDLRSSEQDTKEEIRPGWTPALEFFMTSQTRHFSQTTTCTVFRGKATTEGGHTTAECGFLDLRESREDEITIPNPDSLTVPKVLMSQEEALERLEFRQTMTEYNITHTLEVVEERQHTCGQRNPVECTPRNGNLNRGVLKSETLLKVAKQLGHQWKDIGLLLGVDQASLEYIEIDYNQRIRQGVMKMLLDWRMTSKDDYQGTVSKLRNALETTGKRHLLHYLEP